MSLDNINWIFVTGGNLSGLGKGIVSSSIAKLLEPNNVINVKCDGYLNVDPGTINPYEHGEVFVLEDGGEVDMDFGHYERFTNRNSKFSHNLTTGKIFNEVFRKERKGKYLGKTVQIFPHVIEEIKNKWVTIAEKEKPSVMLIEIGGTIDDIEESWFIRAASEIGNDFKKVHYCHLAFSPVLGAVGEQKTRLIQESVQSLQEKLIKPDIIFARSEDKITNEAKRKIAKFCGIKPEYVISDPHLKTIYELPLVFEEEGLRKILEELTELRTNPNLHEWKSYVNKIINSKNEINIAICGKYTGLHDSYASIIESLVHAASYFDSKPKVSYIEMRDVASEEEVKRLLSNIDGIIVPGGFGSAGLEGKISVAKYARENNVPYLGLCLGLQIAVIEYARNVCKLYGAHTTEVIEDGISVTHPVIDILPEQKKVRNKGASMRLGAYTAYLKENSLVSKLYNSTKISERHRHRYEVNPEYHNMLLKNGLVFSGTNEDGRLVEFIEIPEHKYFVATQAHPEFKSRLNNPSPLFMGFVKACLKK